MKNSCRIMLFILAPFTLMSTAAFSSSGLVNYKGRLTDLAGVAVTTQVNVTSLFNVRRSATG